MHGTAAQMPSMPPAPKLIDVRQIQAFVDPLPILPVAKSSGTRKKPGHPSIELPCFRIPISETPCKVHRDIPATRFWSYGGSFPGPTIEARSGSGLLVEWSNELPAKHFLPIDHKLMGAEADKPEVRTVVHVHGAKAPSTSDGYPEDWYVPGNSARYYYPNEQEAAMLWYHDHAMGINRLNIMAGMMGLFIVRDAFEKSLNLPSGDFEIPLILCDRMFRADGQLYYPVSQRPEAPWIAEFAGDANLINGKLFPFLEVAPRKYRFRILNGSNAVFYFLSLTESLQMHQIGTDQGLLPAPVQVKRLNLSPGERADIVVDFSDHAGGRILLQDGTNSLLQFRVRPAKKVDTSSLPTILRPVPRLKESDAVRTRELALVELDNVLDEPMTHLLDGKRWHDPISENPIIDTTEIWSLINTTDDSHPIHLHLVRFQILDRRPFEVTEYLVSKRIRYTGKAVPPEPSEAGWKDTVRASPGAVTRIIAKFEGYTGRYVWHCHILEHEDNEMMRPYEVVPAKIANDT
jgi:spore coat protein A, manganese oxidase